MYSISPKPRTSRRNDGGYTQAYMPSSSGQSSSTAASRTGSRCSSRTSRVTAPLARPCCTAATTASLAANGTWARSTSSYTLRATSLSLNVSGPANVTLTDSPAGTGPRWTVRLDVAGSQTESWPTTVVWVAPTSVTVQSRVAGMTSSSPIAGPMETWPAAQSKTMGVRATRGSAASSSSYSVNDPSAPA